jgi:protein-S-isoprenylcysteine O-methyltransferase Ste14
MDAGAKFVMLAPIVPLIAFGIIFFKPPWTPLRIFGFILFVSGFALLTWARATLGNSFSITPQAKALVTGGVYSKVRHPVYVFGALMITGLLLYTNMPWLLLTLVVIIPLQIVRARAEEKVLVEKFGDEYLAYKKNTWI